MTRGRPTDYKPEYCDQVFKLCLLGATDKQIANFFDVDETTINNWKKKHNDFLQSIKSGKERADTEIAMSLYHRAKGYEHPEDKIFNANGEALVVPTIKHYPPDTTAGIFWLKNRHPELWRDIKAVEHTGAGGGPVKHEFDLSRYTQEELDNVVEVARKIAAEDGEEL